MTLLPTSFYVSECRRRLDAARSQLCAHGVRPSSCADHRAELRRHETKETPHA